MTKLFTPIKLGPLNVKNRLWVAPMCQYSATAQNGQATDWHLMHYGGLAAGGAGLIVVEATAVAPEGRITPWDLGLWDDAQIAPLARVAAFIKSQGAIAAIQLGHAGRKGATSQMWAGSTSLGAGQGGYGTVSASGMAFADLPRPRVLTDDETAALPGAFAAAAIRAEQAGFEAIELHAAHGYLLHQFLSPLTNQRGGVYGGPLENRCKLVLDTVQAVREGIGPRAALLMRVSATDWVQGGWDVDQTAYLARQAVKRGLDHLDVSSGGLVPEAKVPVGPAYQAPLAVQLRQAADVSVNAVGVIDTAALADSLITSGEPSSAAASGVGGPGSVTVDDAVPGVDSVMAGRVFLRDPHTPIKWATELGEEPASWSPSAYAMAGWARYYGPN
ncbi:MAG: NADH:flavin oxidoreductase/NADH oxidase [Bifidobacteriaceae bacterium]|jgi:2,4-dienoyl-CoA reductase-like NADH-dependent reductase (Old Yellow Enzyme family)|nr:NADH:flavin oxidoreductase/NADH oxidase [Bifidobacteriaceae bacterium]